MSQALVSLVVTVYNAESFLRECLESVCSQSCEQVEVIAVDDGSRDDSPRICDEFEAKYSFFSVIHKVNEGVSVARNTGMEHAHGKYISFIDSDDIVDSDFCRIMTEAAEKNEADIVVCDYCSFGIRGSKESAFTPETPDVEVYKRESILRTLYRGYGPRIANSVVSAGVTWGKMYRLDFIRRIGTQFIPGLVRAQDTVFWLNTLVQTDKLVHVPAVLYHYRLNDQSVCGGSRYFADSEKPFGMLLEEYRSFIDRNRLGDEYLQAWYCRIIEVLFWHWKHNYFNSKNEKGFFRRVREFCALMRRSPYREAIRSVDASKLSRREKGLVLAARCRLAGLYTVCYRGLEKIKELRK